MLIEKVFEFNSVMLGHQHDHPHTLDQGNVDFIRTAITEELDELSAASSSGGSDVDTMVGQADALLDLMYFTIGGFTRMGLSPGLVDEMFNVVHQSNMAKARGPKAGRVTDLPDATKPEGWIPPEDRLKEILIEYIRRCE